MKTNVLLITLLAIAICVTPASAQVETPEALAYYDAQIEVLLPHLATFQETYHAANGMYYQALESHSTVPDAPLAPDGLDSAPTDQYVNLAWFWYTAGLPDTLAWAFRIDTYAGPDGDGYVLTVTTDLDGQIWTRAINHGPDTWRSADWYQVIPEE